MKIYHKNLSHIHFSNDLIDKYNIFLTKEELLRFKSITISHVKRNFIFGRLLLRQKLSEYLNCSDEDILFRKTKFGKLELSGKFLNHDIKFNLSHCKDVVVVVICNSNVGIDVEYCADRDFTKIVNHCFAEEEKEYLEFISSNYSRLIYNKIFYLYWTLKESFIKYKGGSILEKNIDIDFDLYHNLKLDNIINKSTNSNQYQKILSISKIDKKLSFGSFLLNKDYIISYAKSCA